MNTPGTKQEGISTWDIDPSHTVAEFKVRHMAISNVKGQFAKVTGSLTLNDRDLTKAHVEATIDASSIETRDAGRDTHLKSADFLDVEQFPSLIFQSTSIKLVRPGELAVEGDLTIRGITRRVVFDVEGPTPPEKDPWGNLRVAVSATTKISRKEFGLVWNAVLESGGFLVGDDVTIALDVQFVRASV
jgi:polyisoprenoid-binding protein YceI